MVVAALGAPCMPHLPRAALLPALQPALQRVSQLLCGAAKAGHSTRVASTAARKAMQLLAAVAEAEVEEGGDGRVGGAAQSEAKDAALLLVLQFLLPVRRALKVGCRSEHLACVLRLR